MTPPLRILLVDDEAAVTRLLTQYLEREGYAVEVRASAEEGLAKFSEDPEAWDLVLTDLTLPGAHGDAMLKQMLVLRPALRALVSSGYPFSVEGLPTVLPKQIGFLQKPYLPKMLADTLAKMLKKPKP